MAETSEAKLPDKKWGEVVFAGGTDWEKVGKHSCCKRLRQQDHFAHEQSRTCCVVVKHLL